MGSFIKDGVFYEELFEGEPFEKISGTRIDEILYQGSSQYQDILVFDSVGCGRFLILDGLIQLSDKDEFSYHETLSFAALTCHKEPKKVLIIGGGDGGMAREVAKFPSIQSVTVCEIDQEVVNVCTKLFPGLSRSFKDPKVDLVIEDAFEFMKDKVDHYDVIIGDSTDPNRDDEASCLFTEEFYTMVKTALTANGVFLSQTGNSMWKPKLKGLQKILSRRFPVVDFGFVSVPSYDCTQNGFVICSKNENLDVRNPHWTFSDGELDKMELQYYNSDIHKSCFLLPTFAKKYLKESTKEQTDVVEWMKSRKTNNYKIIQNGNY